MCVLLYKSMHRDPSNQEPRLTGNTPKARKHFEPNVWHPLQTLMKRRGTYEEHYGETIFW